MSAFYHASYQVYDQSDHIPDPIQWQPQHVSYASGLLHQVQGDVLTLEVYS